METGIAKTNDGNGAMQTAASADAERAQRELVRRTLFPNSSDDELTLYFHDCARQGVHPLDRLIHPTMRVDRKTGTRRYTPITSIDLMRSRADEEGTYAGNDEPTFTGEPGAPDFSATVVVWKIVGGVRCPFPGTARWSEYYPGDEGGFMWRGKPHLMLGKVAEARALRKAFPRKLGRLYAKEEMDRVEDGVIFDAPAASIPAPPSMPRTAAPPARLVAPAAARVDAPPTSAPRTTTLPGGSTVVVVKGGPTPPADPAPLSTADPGRPVVVERPTEDPRIKVWGTEQGEVIHDGPCSAAAEKVLGRYIHGEEWKRDNGKWDPKWAKRNAARLEFARLWRGFRQAQEAGVIAPDNTPPPVDPDEPPPPGDEDVPF